MFQNRFMSMYKATLQKVTSNQIDASSIQLCEQLKEKTEELRKMDIESPWERGQPGQRSDEVIGKCICLSLVWVGVGKGVYYTTQAVRGPITKINQSKCSIAGPIFSKYRTGHCPE